MKCTDTFGFPTDVPAAAIANCIAAPVVVDAGITVGSEGLPLDVNDACLLLDVDATDWLVEVSSVTDCDTSTKLEITTCVTMAVDVGSIVDEDVNDGSGVMSTLSMLIKVPPIIFTIKVCCWLLYSLVWE